MAGGADMLAGLGGGAPQATADQVLAQIRQLLDQYLAMGPDTPVAAEAQGLAQAIDSQTGAGDVAGAPDPNGPADPNGSLTASTPVEATEPAPDAENPKDIAAEDSSAQDSYKKKRPGAKAFLQGRNAKG